MTLNDPNPGFKGNPFSGGEKHSLGRRSCAALSPWVVDNGFIYTAYKFQFLKFFIGLLYY